MPDNIRHSYDAAAEAYASHLAMELEQKPLDRHLLNRFAEATRGLGPVADLGCGPGHVSRYLSDQGVSITGVDFSTGMITVARGRNPGIEFRVGDMTALDFESASLAGIVAFYSIVHFEPEELPGVFEQMRRVLRPDGFVLMSFHAGDQIVQVDELFGVPVSLDFRFHVPAQVRRTLREARFRVVEEVEREPYEGAEYPSRRCYLLARPAEAAFSEGR
ncbi:MAG: class I SAM-dependent methyltransferase [Acidobacteriota bacterium]